MTQSASSSSSSGPVHFYCSSGGNAGLACAHSAISLGLPATIVIPLLASPLMKAKLLELGVDVHQVGANWLEADTYLRTELLAKDPNGVYVPPFDDPRIWDGAETLVHELREQMREPVDAIVCSVGGGGLVNGIMQGVQSLYPHGPSQEQPLVLAVETHGADSLNASVRAGSHVTLPGITSIATSLGAPRVSARTWEFARDSSSNSRLKSIVVSDADAAMSCVRFADDARHLVEAACGATLAPAYRGDLRELVGKGLSDEEWARKNVVLVVCGGSNVTLGILEGYRAKYAGESVIKA